MNLANKITLTRLGLSILFAVIFFIDNIFAKFAALFIAILVELTDLLDGKVARSRKQVTAFGKLLDPAVDSISRLIIFISFAVYTIQANVHLIPVWMVIVLLIRDSTVAFLRSLAAYQNIIIHARTSGKIKAIVQGFGIISILSLLILKHYFSSIPLNLISYLIMLGVTLVTIWSCFDYVLGNKDIIRKLEK
tara:strand:- start:1073 stop:1648 length:576 start_codon:yes stop_codon:yes gene_type:complete